MKLFPFYRNLLLICSFALSLTIILKLLVHICNLFGSWKNRIINWLIGSAGFLQIRKNLKFLLRKFVPAFAEHFRVMCVLEVRGIETFPRNFLLNATIRSQLKFWHNFVNFPWKLPEGFPKNPRNSNFSESSRYLSRTFSRDLLVAMPINLH